MTKADSYVDSGNSVKVGKSNEIGKIDKADKIVVTGNVCVQIYVNCPYCHKEFNLMDFSVDGDLFFENVTEDWGELDIKVVCPECENKVIVNRFEY